MDGIKIGTVSTIQPDKGTATVIIEEVGEPVSHVLPIMVQGSLSSKHYWMPAPKEPVICAFLPYHNYQGFILGSFYSEENPPPISEPHKRAIHFGDGATITYDTTNQELLINFSNAPKSGKVIIQNGQLIEN
jgi:phage baseplate assembly protein V